jgi:hypothetical protein
MNRKKLKLARDSSHPPALESHSLFAQHTFAFFVHTQSADFTPEATYYPKFSETIRLYAPSKNITRTL